MLTMSSTVSFVPPSFCNAPLMTPTDFSISLLLRRVRCLEVVVVLAVDVTALPGKTALTAEPSEPAEPAEPAGEDDAAALDDASLIDAIRG